MIAYITPDGFTRVTIENGVTTREDIEVWRARTIAKLSSAPATVTWTRKKIRPTLTAAELRQLDATVATMDAFAAEARQAADECRANGWTIRSQLTDYQPCETHGDDWGHWIYEHLVYDENGEDIGVIGYDGCGLRVKGERVHRFIWEPRLQAEGIDTSEIRYSG
jgi:hypothetical protein